MRTRKKDFTQEQRVRQIAWREENISTIEWGVQNGGQYEHIIPKTNWEETLWVGIRSTLPIYLKKKKVKEHTGVHNLMSSWVLAANLYFPIRENKVFKELMLQFLRTKISNDITELCQVELEFAFPEGDQLHPSPLLGEKDGNRGSGQTSPDVAFLVKTTKGDGLILTECKFSEHSFYSCSARRTEDKGKRKGNPNPKQCLKATTEVPHWENCHQAVWGRMYWNHLKLSEQGIRTFNRCPAATTGYQLFRQQSLAEGIKQSNRFDLVASTVAFDGNNEILKHSLKATGVNDFQTDWASLFEGEAIFTTWTHQEWVQFVREHQTTPLQADWVKYMEERYGY